MNKIFLVIRREYLARVRKKSFLIMTLLTPVLFALLIIVPVYIMKNPQTPTRNFAVIDNSNLFSKVFVSNDKYKFSFINQPQDSLLNYCKKNNIYAVVVIPENYLIDSVQIYSQEPITLDVKGTFQSLLDAQAMKMFLEEQHIDPAILAQAHKEVPLKTYQWSNENGKAQDSSSEVYTALGYIGAFIIYMFILIYGAQLMRSSMEEKKDRIMEILVSSVKPFNLMMGKVIGVALVAFTQFFIWIAAAIFLISSFHLSAHAVGGMQFLSVLTAIKTVNITKFVILFLIYFIGGYLLYGSLFAAIGAAVDNETDTQQFMLPLTLPLILSVVFAQSVITEPNGQLAVILSMIPFTSPVVMLVRVGFGVSFWQMALSISLLVLTFLLCVYLAAKIYRIGILAYGKKITYHDLWKWIKYKG